jgi:hypothetical protein
VVGKEKFLKATKIVGEDTSPDNSQFVDLDIDEVAEAIVGLQDAGFLPQGVDLAAAMGLGVEIGMYLQKYMENDDNV